MSNHIRDQTRNLHKEPNNTDYKNKPIKVLELRKYQIQNKNKIGNLSFIYILGKEELTINDTTNLNRNPILNFFKCFCLRRKY